MVMSQMKHVMYPTLSLDVNGYSFQINKLALKA